MEPIWKSVSSVTGSGWSTLVTPKALVTDLAVAQNTEGHTWNAELHHLRLYGLGDALESGVGGLSRRSRRRALGPQTDQRHQQ